MIAKFKKPGRWSATAVLLIGALGLVTLTDGQTNNPENEPVVEAGESLEAEASTQSGAQSGTPEEGAVVEPRDLRRIDMRLPRWGGATARIEPESLVRIGGTVVDHQGNVVVGAKVITLKGNPALPGQLVDAATDEAGRWELETVVPTVGSFRMWVEYAGHRNVAYATGPRPHGGTANQVRLDDLLAGSAMLTLPEGFEVTGSVKNSTGEPIAGASVILSDELLGEWNKTTTSEENGQFVLTDVNRGRTLIVAKAGGFAPEYQWRVVGENRGPITFELEHGHTYGGRLSNSEGEPIEGARVKVEHWNTVRVPLGSTTTDAEGRYILDSLPADGIELSIEARGYLRPVLVHPDVANENNDYVLEPSVEITGRVVDAENGKPLNYFSVSSGTHWPSRDWIQWGTPRVVRGTGGVFYEYLTNTRQDFGIKVEAGGYVPVVVKSLSANDGEREITIALNRGEGPRGMVVAEDGSPVVGAAVAFGGDGVRMSLDSHLTFSAFGGPSGHTTVSDAQGRFSFPPKAEGTVIIAAHALGYREMSFNKDQTEYRIELEPAGSISGRLDVSGIDVVRQEVVLHSGSMATIDQWVMFTSFRTVTSANGDFNFDWVPPGNRWIAWHRQSSTGIPELVMHMDVQVVSGEQSEVVFERPGRVITGKLRLADASQPPYWRDVRLHPKDRMRPFPPNDGADRSVLVLVNEEGLFSSLPVEPGEYTLSVFALDSEIVNEFGGGGNEVGRLYRMITVPDGDGPYHLGVVEVPMSVP